MPALTDDHNGYYFGIVTHPAFSRSPYEDNTLYAPLKREVLACEIEILRALNGQHFCIGMRSVYETARAIYMVIEYCAGGEMMEYVSKQQEDLRTDDVSRIAFQMLDAVNHCAQHNIIHRDIKPEVR